MIFGGKWGKLNSVGMKFAEIHCHTLYSNSKTTECLTTPAGLIEECKKKGLSAVAITDHDTMEGYRRARRYAKKHGITLIPGVEIDGNRCGQILAYGIKQTVMPKRDPIEIIKDVQKAGGVAIIPHPMDVIRKMENLGEVVKHADGVEGTNYGAVNNWWVRRFARKNKIRVVTGGSDAHHRSLIGTVVLGFPDSCRDEKDYINCLKRGRFTVRVNRSYCMALGIGILNVLHTRFVGLVWNVFPSGYITVEIDGVFYLIKVMVRAPFKLSFTVTKNVYRLSAFFLTQPFKLFVRG